jgi:hypothetical protein
MSMSAMSVMIVLILLLIWLIPSLLEFYSIPKKIQVKFSSISAKKRQNLQVKLLMKHLDYLPNLTSKKIKKRQQLEVRQVGQVGQVGQQEEWLRVARQPSNQLQ